MTSETARHLLQGVDVWLNTPRRPYEACGTSGQKIIINGGLNIERIRRLVAEMKPFSAPPIPASARIITSLSARAASKSAISPGACRERLQPARGSYSLKG